MTDRPVPAPPTLTDGTVTLRPLGEADVEGCYQQCVDPLSIAWTQVPVPYSRADAREFCLDVATSEWRSGSQFILGVEAPGTGPGGYAGNVALRDEGNGRVEVAYGAHPAARGTGAMERGMRLLLEWGFDHLGYETAIWRANVGNWGSRDLAHRLGFSVDGVLRHSHVSRGELTDAWVGTLRREEARAPRHRWLRTPVLELDDVRLRPLTEADAPRVQQAGSDPRMRRWFPRLPDPYDEGAALRWIGRTREYAATGTAVHWAVTEPGRRRDALLGSVDLHQLDPRASPERPGRAAVGGWVHPDARGRGLMSTAVRAAIGWGFAELGIAVAYATTGVENTAARHVLGQAGLRGGAVERLGGRDGGELRDAVRYDVTAAEWPAPTSASTSTST